MDLKTLFGPYIPDCLLHLSRVLFGISIAYTAIVFITLLRIYVAPDQQKEAVKILSSIKPAIMSKRGFVSSAIYWSNQEEGSILYIEKWRTRESLHRHIRSPLYLRILTVMDFSKRKPEINFCESEEGFDLIHELRK